MVLFHHLHALRPGYLGSDTLSSSRFTGRTISSFPLLYRSCHPSVSVVFLSKILCQKFYGQRAVKISHRNLSAYSHSRAQVDRHGFLYIYELLSDRECLVELCYNPDYGTHILVHVTIFYQTRKFYDPVGMVAMREILIVMLKLTKLGHTCIGAIGKTRKFSDLINGYAIRIGH